MISHEVKLPHPMWLEYDHKVWKDSVFHRPKEVIPVETDLIEKRDRQGLVDPTWGHYQNIHFLVPKMTVK